MKMRGLGFLAFLMWCFTIVSAQMDTSVSVPTMQPFKPQFSSSLKPFVQTSRKGQVPSYSHVPVQRGLHAKDVLRQAQMQAYTSRGLPYYPNGATREEIQKINQARIQQEIRNANPTRENNFKQQNNAINEVDRELVYHLKESHRNRLKVKSSDYAVSPNYYNDLPNYLRAKREIKDQLSGKKPLSYKDAYYYAEAAYGSVHLTYEEYDRLIQQNKEYILQWLQQEGYNLEDQEALHYGIQRFLSDTLHLRVDDPDQVFDGNHLLTHNPFYYDYIDNDAVEDRRNYFVTKTLATGSGQCHTLPVTYLILAEALGIEANLTFIPLHSTVRYKNNAGMTLNYETTVNRFLPDQAYLDMQPAMAKGMKSGIFLKDMTKKQVVATVLIDLGVNFILEHWFADEKIVQDCILTSEKYFPNEEYVNTSSLWIKKKTLSNRFNALVEKHGVTDLNQIENIPEVKMAYLRLKAFLQKANEIGLEEFPESEYISMMAYHDDQARLQISKNMDNKSKRDLFIKQRQ